MFTIRKLGFSPLSVADLEQHFKQPGAEAHLQKPRGIAWFLENVVDPMELIRSGWRLASAPQYPKKWTMLDRQDRRRFGTRARSRAGLILKMGREIRSGWRLEALLVGGVTRALEGGGVGRRRARAPSLILPFGQALLFGCAHHSAACAAGQSSSWSSRAYAAHGALCRQASHFVRVLSHCGSARPALLRSII
jgi:hypothetical protein